jgi:hypothetical protein
MKYPNLLISILIVVNFYSCNDKGHNAPNSVIPEAVEFKPADNYNPQKLNGQLIYVPIYSSIYSQYKGRLLHMTAILSLRNISPKSEIIIKKIDYYDTNGKLIKSFIQKPFALGKMSTKDFVIAENDLEGGTGANFIIEWDSIKKVSLPIFEAVMIGNSGSQGFSFTSRGKEIEAH